MRIAYLILCHTDPAHIARLCRKITTGTDHIAFVHVDGKSDISPFENLLKGLSHVCLIQDRTNVFWGGTAQLKLRLN